MVNSKEILKKFNKFNVEISGRVLRFVEILSKVI